MKRKQKHAQLSINQARILYDLLTGRSSKNVNKLSIDLGWVTKDFPHQVTEEGVRVLREYWPELADDAPIIAAINKVVKR